MIDRIHITNGRTTCVGIAQVGMHELDPIEQVLDVAFMAGRKIVYDPDAMSDLEQAFGDVGTDKASSPGDQGSFTSAHIAPLLFRADGAAAGWALCGDWGAHIRAAVNAGTAMRV